MTPQEAITFRLLHQHLIAPQTDNPEAIVSWQGAMQAQDYNYFRWAIGIRQSTPQLSALHEAFATGQLLRLHLLRCTVQVVSKDDISWFITLCQERNLRTLQSWHAYTQAHFSESYLAEIFTALREILAGGKSLPKTAIASQLTHLGLLPTTDYLNPLLLRAEIDGLLCSGEISGRNATWALLSDRVPYKAELSFEESMALLARKYFRSHSPATTEDFAWWSGFPLTQCRKAIEAIAAELQEIEVAGTPMYLYYNSLPHPDYTKTVHLLPPYDEYLIGYKSRWVSLDKEHEAKAHSKNGLFKPVILHEGRVVGNWKGTINSPDKPIITELFAETSKVKKTALREAEERFKKFCNQ